MARRDFEGYMIQFAVMLHKQLGVDFALGLAKTLEIALRGRLFTYLLGSAEKQQADRISLCQTKIAPALVIDNVK